MLTVLRPPAWLAQQNFSTAWSLILSTFACLAKLRTSPPCPRLVLTWYRLAPVGFAIFVRRSVLCGLSPRPTVWRHLLPRQCQHWILAPGHSLHCRVQVWHQQQRSEAVRDLSVQRRVERDRGQLQAGVLVAAAVVPPKQRRPGAKSESDP